MLKEELMAYGDQVVVSAGNGILRGQVFSAFPEEVLKFLLDRGRLSSFLAAACSAAGKVRFPEPPSIFPQSKKEDQRLFSAKPEVPLYCTEFSILKDVSDRPMEPGLRALLKEIGDSAVISEGDDLVKCHVHTSVPQQAVLWQTEGGYLIEVKVEALPC